MRERRHSLTLNNPIQFVIVLDLHTPERGANPLLGFHRTSVHLKFLDAFTNHNIVVHSPFSEIQFRRMCFGLS